MASEPGLDTGDFDRILAAADLAGFWTARVPAFQPEGAHLWPWVSVRDALHRASREIGIEAAERRVIKLVHPVYGARAASRTVQPNFSIVNGGEVAHAHRHSIAAIRFVVEGRGATTTVDGVCCTMNPGDLIITPAGSWHDHHNDSDEPIIWLDGLDGPLVQALNGAFFEAAKSARQSITERDVRYRVSWQEALTGLERAGSDPFDGRVFRYPSVNGQPDTLPTMGCELAELSAGWHGGRHRHTHVVAYHVVEGSGETAVEDTVLRWSRGDTFLVPAWRWHAHSIADDGPARLFSINDRPALQALGLHREDCSA